MRLARLALLDTKGMQSLAAESWSPSEAILAVRWTVDLTARVQWLVQLLRTEVERERSSVLQIHPQGFRMLNKCGVCREPGHWKTECPQVARTHEQALALPPQERLVVRRFGKHPFCLCDQRQGPDVLPRVCCLFCRHACCGRAYQLTPWTTEFECDTHGDSNGSDAIELIEQDQRADSAVVVDPELAEA